MYLPPIPGKPLLRDVGNSQTVISTPEQDGFNRMTAEAIRAHNDALASMHSTLVSLEQRLVDQNLLYTHFQQFVHDHHPDVIKEYAATLLVQAKLEQANGN